jgi:hypothetical protein
MHSGGSKSVMQPFIPLFSAPFYYDDDDYYYVCDPEQAESGRQSIL